MSTGSFLQRMPRACYGIAIVLASCLPSLAAVDFRKEIQPIIESTCLSCHNEAKAEGGLRLDSLAAATAGGEHEPAIVAGDPAKSPLYTRMVLAAGDEHIMPPKSRPLDESQTSIIRKWIEEGASGRTAPSSKCKSGSIS